MSNRDQSETEDQSGLANLFNLAFHETEETDSRSHGEIYRALISYRIEERGDCGTASGSDWSIDDVWNEPEPSVDRLMSIKCFAQRHLRVSERSCYPEEVTAFVRWVTCAVAWNRLGMRFSGLSAARARDAWRWCEEREWVTTEVSTHLWAAQQRVGWDSAARVAVNRAEPV